MEVMDRKISRIPRALADTVPVCPIERTLAIVGAKWTLLILRDLIERPHRFSEIERSLQTASPKIISARLRALERLGLVSRTVFPEVPPRVVYALTPRGRSLTPVVDALRAWGNSLDEAS